VDFFLEVVQHLLVGDGFMQTFDGDVLSSATTSVHLPKGTFSDRLTKSNFRWMDLGRSMQIA